MYVHLNLYIDLNWEIYADKGVEYIRSIYKIVKLAKLHKCNIYYCNSQLKDFTKNCQDLDANFSKSAGNQLDLLLKIAIIAPVDNSYLFEIQFQNEGSYISYVENDLLQVIKHNQIVAVITSNDMEDSKSFLRINTNYQGLINVFFLRENESLIEWISKNGEPRNFHLSPKHGENGVGNWPGESVLRCNEKDAQLFLNKSIADFDEKNRFFFFDDNHDTYIEFFYEGNNPQKQWHGFHLSKNDWHQRVPNSVKKFFNRF